MPFKCWGSGWPRLQPIDTDNEGDSVPLIFSARSLFLLASLDMNIRHLIWSNLPTRPGQPRITHWFLSPPHAHSFTHSHTHTWISAPSFTLSLAPLQPTSTSSTSFVSLSFPPLYLLSTSSLSPPSRLPPLSFHPPTSSSSSTHSPSASLHLPQHPFSSFPFHPNPCPFSFALSPPSSWPHTAFRVVLLPQRDKILLTLLTQRKFSSASQQGGERGWRLRWIVENVL